MMLKNKALRSAAGLSLCALVAGASAMEDESIYSATRVTVDTGKVRGQAGSVQSIGIDGWVGGDINRLWYQYDGERSGGRTATSELQLLYGRYIAPFWDGQIGLRRDDRPDGKSYLAMGVRGLAPYAFDVDLKLYVRDDGKVFARTLAETDFLLTNRFIVTPSVGIEWSSSNVDATTRSGPYQADVGLRARYEFNRRITPFVDVSRTFYPRAAEGGESASTRVSAGLRMLF